MFCWDIWRTLGHPYSELDCAAQEDLRDDNPCPSLVPVTVFYHPHGEDFFLDTNFLSTVHALTFSSCPCALLQGDGHVSYLASQHTRAGRVPTSPDKHAKTATIPFRAWVFLPREDREPKLWSRRSIGEGILLQRALWLHRPKPQHLTLWKHQSDFPAAGPGLLSFPPGDPPLPLRLPSWASQTITAPAWSEKGAAKPHARLGRRAPWGAGGRAVWSGRDSVSCSPFCCPSTQQAGKWSDSGGWARFSAHRQLSDGSPQSFALCMTFPRQLNLRHLLLHPTLISLSGLAKAHQC